MNTTSAAPATILLNGEECVLGVTPVISIVRTLHNYDTVYKSILCYDAEEGVYYIKCADGLSILIQEKDLSTYKGDNKKNRNKMQKACTAYNTAMIARLNAQLASLA